MSDPYRRVTKLPVETDPEPEQDVMAIQARIDWVQSTGTQLMIKALIKQSDSLVADAIGLSLVNHQQDNSKQIVHKLIQAETLRKMIEKYGTVK